MATSKDAQVRSRHLSILVLVFFILILTNLVRMQIFEYETFKRLSDKNRIRVIYLEGPRGRILDRNKIVMAGNRLSYNCSAIIHEAKPKLASSLAVLAPILGEDPAVLEERFFDKKKRGAFNTVILAEDLSPRQAMAVEEAIDLMPGFMIETRPQREYPQGPAAAHLVGFIGPLNAEESADSELYDYSRSDWTGRDGIEKHYESYLRGRAGGLQMEVNSRGRFVRTLGIKEPRDGKDLQLTIDTRLQAYVQSLLKTQKGAVAVIELGEGGLLSLNSSPSFDPNLFASKVGRKDVSKYLTDKRAPMVNRALRGQYPPGSIFKIVTALAALDAGTLRPTSKFNCGGSLTLGGNRFGCWKEAGHGIQTLSDAFAHSCNVYFYMTGLSCGGESIYRKAIEMGFTRTSGIDLPGERKGFVPSPEWKRRSRKMRWFNGDTANLSIGQGSLQVTPIQALMMAAYVASKGRPPTPHVIDRIGGVKVSDGRRIDSRANREHLDQVEQGLDAVINSDTGTGRLARMATFRVAGKTGTAQSGQDKTHAWFVGYAPLPNPKIALVVFLENGGRGGVAAATLARQVLEKLSELHYL